MSIDIACENIYVYRRILSVYPCRLVEITTSHLKARSCTSSSTSGKEYKQESTKDGILQVAREVFIHTALTCKDLMECLEVLEKEVPSRGVGVVILDSVASLVRKEFDVTCGAGAMERTAFLLRVSAKLK